MGEQKGGSVVTENPKAGIAENFGRIQSGDHSNLLGKGRRGGEGGEIVKVIKGRGEAVVRALDSHQFGLG